MKTLREEFRFRFPRPQGATAPIERDEEDIAEGWIVTTSQKVAAREGLTIRSRGKMRVRLHRWERR